MSMGVGKPLPGWCEATCIVCPAQRFGPGGFDVAEAPAATSRYDPSLGFRVDTTTGAAVCVHPFRVGLPPGRYCSEGQPLPSRVAEPLRPSPAALELPQDATDLEGWLVAVLMAAWPRVASAAVRAEATARSRFGDREVVAALRRAFSSSEVVGR